jgi:hypothetical protein
MHGSTPPELKQHLFDVLHGDDVLGPLLEYGRCIITRRGLPGRDCCWGMPNATCATAATHL